MKAEKYIIVTEVSGQSDSRVRWGFGAAGEEVQKLLQLPGLERISIKIESKGPTATFQNNRQWKLLDIKQRIKGLSLDLD